MPYRVSKGGGTCGTSQFAVISASGRTMGCHSTKESADKQLAALNIHVMSKEAAEETMPNEIVEQQLTKASAPSKTGRIQVQVLTPGWGSSGYYSPKVVEAAAALVKSGLPMYVDHASSSERLDRPGRSVKDIAAKFVTEGKWDGKALVAEAELVPGPYREALIALEDTIGVSINGSASDIVQGDAEGRNGRIIEGLADITSVDFVTRAGRGGRFTALLESALLEESVLTVNEATAADRMGHLRSAVRDVHGGDRKSAWVRDQDAEKSTVWFDVHDHTTDAAPKTYEQTYAVGKNDVDVSLTGEPTEVRPLTKYVPVNPAGPTPTKESKEDTVANIQIEESEHSRLVAEAGRVPTLVTERDTEKARADQLQEEKDQRVRTDAATKIIGERATEAKVTFTALEQRGLMADLPLTDKRELDVEKFTKVVDEQAATRKVEAGAGKITGFGGTPVGESDISWDDIDKISAGAQPVSKEV